MRLTARISGVTGVMAPDSQASHCFIHKDFATAHGIIVSKTQTTVHLANDVSCTTEGTCTVTVRFHQHKKTHTVQAYALACLLPGVDLILGQDWLTKYKVKLDFEKMLCTVDKDTLVPMNTTTTEHILLSYPILQKKPYASAPILYIKPQQSRC